MTFESGVIIFVSLLFLIKLTPMGQPKQLGYARRLQAQTQRRWKFLRHSKHMEVA
jgi:hypothetical protein